MNRKLFIPICRLFLLLSFLTIIISVMSCVSSRKYQELTEMSDKCMKDQKELIGKNEQLTVQLEELNSKSLSGNSYIEGLRNDSIKLAKEYNNLKEELNKLQKQNIDLKQRQEQLMKGSTEENRRLLQQIEKTQSDLQKKEDDLYKLEKTLGDKRQELENMRIELDRKSQRLSELENILNKKDSVVNALRNKVAQALLGFENQGLKVTMKNGKVYVSLDEQLLFSTGSTEVAEEGKKALKKLANVLEQNPDINIMIEGHTDDVKYKPGASIKDNWDLSVMRATAIVRILLDGTSIDPVRLMATGRGEYMPVDPGKTAEARKKNRRTEIILTPKLDELFKILEAN